MLTYVFLFSLVQVADSFKSAGRGLREFDEEHAVVHKATEGIKDAWKGVRQVSETIVTGRTEV